MASTSSFLSHPGGRPRKYRTPSPPRRAIEPISPPAFKSERQSFWNDRSAFYPRDYNSNSYNSPSDPTRRSIGASHTRVSFGHPKAGHGHHRASSSIETLANIALATSPRFPSLSFDPPGNSTRTESSPLFPHTDADSERPAKRARSEKASPAFQHVDTRPATSHVTTVPDSMKTDAELLLNFARPTNFASPHQFSQPSNVFGQPFNQFANDQRLPTINGATSTFPGFIADTLPGSTQSPSRLRSHSDGSAAIARPPVPGLRPNTSSSTLPGVAWHNDAFRNHHNLQDPSSPPDEINNMASPPKRRPTITSDTVKTVPEAKEEEVTPEGNAPANCAACHLVRVDINTEDQGEDTWIKCDGCESWYHIVCAGFKNDREVRTVDKFICRKCRPIHGQTTFVRKSSRARTAIDYAGLNQGLVKSSTDSYEHHYIQPIKDGRIKFLPENFPRMRAELVTAEYFERGVGMTEPIVIPAALNPRTSIDTSELDSVFDGLAGEASTQEMFDEILENQPGEPEIVIDCGQDVLDMVVPQGLTVRAVAELYGPEERVEVIDVKSQQGEDKRWNMQKWADYYESTGKKIVRNVISLEVSQSPLGKLIRRPKIVRDLDLQDSVWPEELKAAGDYPKVQFYCLMSVADCYTDFHIDFGGSSVYYTILKGKKTFFFIPPKEKHLKKYEEWCNSPAQDTTFLGDQTKECYRVDLEEGDTMLIPAGWIHAVWTPENSLVIGGNFLTRMNYGMQIKVAKIEKDTKVPRKFRYPFFQKIQWYTALKYLNDDPVPDSVLDAFSRDEHYRFYRQFPIYYEFGERENRSVLGSPYYNARFYSQAELEGLPELLRYLLRTALIAGGYSVDGVTAEARNAVKRSIPKMQGDPIEVAKKFAVWIAWKRGNETAASWTRPGAISSTFKIDQVEKRPAGRPSRRSERHADAQKMYAERQSLQLVAEQPQEPQNAFPSSTPHPPDNVSPVLQPFPQLVPVAITPAATAPSITTPTTSTPAIMNPIVKEEPVKPRTTNKGSGLGPKRVACDACRRRRIRCRHKDEQADGWSLGVSPNPAPLGTMFDSVDPQRQSILARDAASVLNALASVATETTLQDGSEHLPYNTDGFPRDNVGFLSGISQSAYPRPVEGCVNGNNGGKKGRSKACDECRKSKRRCIHDEYGRIDPVKAQERSKPRATSSAKRPRPNEEGIDLVTNKKVKTGVTAPVSDSVNYFETDQAISSYLPASSTHVLQQDQYQQQYYMHDPDGISTVQSPPEERLDQKIEMADITYTVSPNPKINGDASVVSLQMQANQQMANPLASPPTSLLGEAEILPPQRPGEELHGGSVTVDGEHEALHTPNSSSRHSSRQPRQVDRFVPEQQAGTKSSTTAKQSTMTSSSRHPTKASSVTSSHTKKSSSRPSSSHAKKSTSPSVEKKLARPSTTSPNSSKNVKRERTSFTADDTTEADAESLRLIRELQEQDFGLRRRAARV
ncbi:PHD finger and JmjC domain protein, putative [Talaromyces stipitatus ATCC 10500]|uniref:JmjC domain-containing histone demethylation protein 1 n=1 Tax=Talaromyces stipitatus (strain ATCC 10500 / CBS 375.48 / QM 6759 / NRRL 1006) TaxID=441959 RepID=B8LT66_TALSN|nr:PHD finger and JmjC domain protein, putative [Talaromyces stipitatus ATCC 10500]EED23574.1 PHD finger and JmjC domain protein, putative [Talaromyces stipitatus ATCC 10500]